MANTYAAGTFTLDTNTNVAGLTALKESPCAVTDSIVVGSGKTLTIESPIVCAALTGSYSITTGQLTIKPSLVRQLCTLAQVKDRMTITTNENDSKTQAIIEAVLPAANARYGREFMPYVTETRTFEVRNRHVPLVASDLRSATSVVLHPEADTPTTLTLYGDYMLDTDSLTGTSGTLRIAETVDLVSEVVRRFGFARVTITGAWGCYDDVSQVPPDLNEAAIETVLSWMSYPANSIAAIDSSDARMSAPVVPTTWDFPAAAHRKFSVYSRNLGVY